MKKINVYQNGEFDIVFKFPLPSERLTFSDVMSRIDGRVGVVSGGATSG